MRKCNRTKIRRIRQNRSTGFIFRLQNVVFVYLFLNEALFSQGWIQNLLRMRGSPGPQKLIRINEVQYCSRLAILGVSLVHQRWRKVLVSFFVLQTLISMSSALGLWPTMPEYMTPGPINRCLFLGRKGRR